MDNAVWLSLLSAAFDSCAYIIYNLEFWRGRSKPNKATWALWFYIATLNASSYLVSSHDVVKTLLALENAGMCGLTLAVVLFRGKSEKLKPWEWVTVASGVATGAVWIISRHAFYANAVLQFGTFISVIPTYAKLWKDPRREPPLPWFMWSVIYIALCVVVMLRWRGSWHDIVYPLNYVLFHFAVFVLTLRRWTKKSPATS